MATTGGFVRGAPGPPLGCSASFIQVFFITVCRPSDRLHYLPPGIWRQDAVHPTAQHAVMTPGILTAAAEPVALPVDGLALLLKCVEEARGTGDGEAAAPLEVDLHTLHRGARRSCTRGRRHHSDVYIKFKSPSPAAALASVTAGL